MKDTAGNKIPEFVIPCPQNCGLTGGCDYCRSAFWKQRFNDDFERKRIALEKRLEEPISKEAEERAYKTIFGSPRREKDTNNT